jgi:acetyl-CoA acetyltransferase
MVDPVIISSYARTPMGGVQGAFTSLSAIALGSHAVRAAVVRSGTKSELGDAERPLRWAASRKATGSYRPAAGV